MPRRPVVKRTLQDLIVLAEMGKKNKDGKPPQKKTKKRKRSQLEKQKEKEIARAVRHEINSNK